MNKNFIAQCGLWHRMEKNIFELQHGGSEDCQEISGTKMLFQEEKGARCTGKEKLEVKNMCKASSSIFKEVS